MKANRTNGNNLDANFGNKREQWVQEREMISIWQIILTQLPCWTNPLLSCAHKQIVE